VTAHEAGVLDTSTITALPLNHSAQLPGTFFITAITLGELSYGLHATDEPLKRAARVAVLSMWSRRSNRFPTTITRRGSTVRSARRFVQPVVSRASALLT
jgi:hypothetical protein